MGHELYLNTAVASPRNTAKLSNGAHPGASPVTSSQNQRPPHWPPCHHPHPLSPQPDSSWGLSKIQSCSAMLRTLWWFPMHWPLLTSPSQHQLESLCLLWELGGTRRTCIHVASSSLAGHRLMAPHRSLPMGPSLTTHFE